MTSAKLERPLVFFAIKATGNQLRKDRLQELAAVRLNPDGTSDEKLWKMSVPSNDSLFVDPLPRFAELADDIEAFFAAADLGGFNINYFDLPLLLEEFARLGRDFNLSERRIIDAQRIFHKQEPRDLSAAVRLYCGCELDGAHGAEADTAATLGVLEGEMRQHPDLPRDPDQLDRLLNDLSPDNVDRIGRLRWENGEIVINFGEKKGLKLRDLVIDDPQFLHFILRRDFPSDTKRIVAGALEGRWPESPTAE